ncbi:hypothetical protein F5Y15DRAFT_126871 [Xylariaceae sp. FL0016]|nr:hypothetical protein F5Y15DRAFT_126871 [Xylariaceae sp. FL0016]
MVSPSIIKPWLREPPKAYLLKNACIVDPVSGSTTPESDVSVSDGKIQSVVPSNPSSTRRDATVVGCRGKYLCPGLFDAHVHLMAVPGFTDLSKAFGNPNDVHVLRQPYVCQQMLHRGFTSVRDCGGAHLALKEAIEDGVFPGPRLFIAGYALSQSGGHADYRGPHDHSACCDMRATGLGRICNGEAECMASVRENIRTGSDFIKIMASGGVSSPTDKLEHLQFTAREIQAMSECARNAGTFVTAHAYTVKAIRHAIDNGAKGIEHGNFLDKPTANLMADRDIYLTPTLITYSEMASPQWDGYLPPESQSKNTEVLNAGLQALRIAADAGVKMCYGTDLLGPLGAAQSHEFRLRGQVLSPVEVLRSATVYPASMMGWGDRLGQIKEGFEADMLILDANPLDNITILDDPEKHVLGVMKTGRIYKSRWADLEEDGLTPVRIKAAL